MSAAAQKTGPGQANAKVSRRAAVATAQRRGRPLSTSASIGACMSSAQTTTDHDEIRRWAESRSGRPSLVPTSGAKGKRKSGGILRFDFGPKDEKLEETSWDEFFQVFDESDLAFLYQ